MALPETYYPQSKPVYYPISDGKPMAETDKHRREMTDELLGLDLFLEKDSRDYVSGNNFIYYEEGDPRKCIPPDVYVVRGVGGAARDCYKVWEEGGRTPFVVIEMTSRKTRVQDRKKKLPIYQNILRVPEVFFFDPKGEYLKPYRLKGFRLQGGQYVELDPVNGRIHSEQLGLDLVIEGDRLRLYDPETGRLFLSGKEYAHRAEQEALRAEAAEAEVRRLREQLEAMTRRTGEG